MLACEEASQAGWWRVIASHNSLQVFMLTLHCGIWSSFIKRKHFSWLVNPRHQPLCEAFYLSTLLSVTCYNHISLTYPVCLLIIFSQKINFQTKSRGTIFCNVSLNQVILFCLKPNQSNHWVNLKLSIAECGQCGSALLWSLQKKWHGVRWHNFQIYLMFSFSLSEVIKLGRKRSLGPYSHSIFLCLTIVFSLSGKDEYRNIICNSISLLIHRF